MPKTVDSLFLDFSVWAHGAVGPRGGRVMNGRERRRRRVRGPKTTFSPLSVITSKPATERAHTGDITLSLLDSNVLFMPLFYHLGVVLVAFAY